MRLCQERCTCPRPRRARYSGTTLVVLIAAAIAGSIAYHVSAASFPVPSLAEAAHLPDYDAGVWIGLAAPAGIPREAFDRLSAEMQKAMASKDLQERLQSSGLDPVASQPEEMPAFLRREQQRYADVIRRARITLE